ncbi:hypothetical protein DP20_3059 [Shigella flexneri]|nr:hypothetical protein DP20_3059 [Shigella flexneri]
MLKIARLIISYLYVIHNINSKTHAKRFCHFSNFMHLVVISSQFMRFRLQNGNEQPCLLIKRTLTIYQMRFVIRSAELAQLWRKWIIHICQMNMSNSLKFD